MSKSQDNALNTAFLEGLLAGNRVACSELTKQFLAMNPSIEDLYEQFFKPSLYRVGVLWETNQISVATEHMATAIVEGLLNELYEQLISKKRYQRSVVLACVEQELHQVGIKMVGDVFEKNGWDSFFLGAGIPTGELSRFIRKSQPDVLAISFSVFFNYPNLLKMLSLIRAEFPNLTILLGGQAIGKLSTPTLPDNCLIIGDLYQLESYIQTINATN